MSEGELASDMHEAMFRLLFNVGYNNFMGYLPETVVHATSLLFWYERHVHVPLVKEHLG